MHRDLGASHIQDDDRWSYLARLQSDSSLFTPRTCLEELSRRFSRQAAEAGKQGGQTCQHRGCSFSGDLRVCQGCLAASYCSRRCRELDWRLGHGKECCTPAELFPPADSEAERVARWHSSWNRGLYEAEQKKNEELKMIVIKKEEELSEAKAVQAEKDEEIKNLKKEVASFKLKRAVDKSSISRLKAKTSTSAMETVETVQAAQQTEVRLPLEDTTLVLMRPAGLTEYKLAEVLRGRTVGQPGERPYGEPLFLRIASARQPGMAEEIGPRTLRNHAHFVMEVLRLLCTAGFFLDSDDVTMNVQLVISQLLSLYKETFSAVVKLQPKLLTQHMMLTTEEASRVMHGLNLNWATRRRQSIMFSKLLHTRLFPSEQKQREHDKEKGKLVAREKLNVGKMLLHKTVAAEFSTPCAYVKVDNLIQYCEELVEQVQIIRCVSQHCLLGTENRELLVTGTWH